MIDPIDLVGPVADQPPGNITIQIEVTSDNEPVGFEDSFKLWVNDVKITDFSAVDNPPWTVTTTVAMLGGQSVKIKFEATDNDETKAAVWTFDVSAEGTFSANQYKRAAFLNSFAEFYPRWTKARSNEYSVFQQFMNPIALKFDEIKLRLQNQNRSLNPSKNLWNDPDWLYEYVLDVGEEFATRLSASGETSFAPPSVWGIRGINRLPLSNVETFSDFWGKALPTRYEATAKESRGTQLTASTPIGEVGSLKDIDVHVPGFLYIWVHSVSGTVSIVDGLKVTNLVLRGEGPEGQRQTEHVPLIRNHTAVTQKAWRKITSVSTEGGPEGASAEFAIYNFPQRALPQNDTMFRAVDNQTIRWKLDEDASGSVLDYEISGNGFLQDIARGEDTFFAKRRYRLRDASGVDVSITDFAIDPTSYRVYGIDQNKLYIWDRRDIWPSSLKLLNGASTSPEVDFHIMEYGDRVLGDGGISYATQLTLELDTPKESKRIRRWHWAISDEAGNRRYISPDNIIQDVGGPFWRYNELPVAFFGIKERNPVIEILATGFAIVELTIEYFGGETEVVRKVWHGREMVAVADYLISQTVSISSATPSVAALEDGSVAVVDSGTAWLLTPQFDTFMADFEAFRVLFRDKFDSIEVDFNE